MRIGFGITLARLWRAMLAFVLNEAGEGLLTQAGEDITAE